jgi:Asparagine synthase
MVIDKDFSVSSYLAFRYIVKKGFGWREELIPEFPVLEEGDIFKVKTSEDVRDALEAILVKGLKKDTGILLSSGIDSAILAALLTKNTPSYTIRFVADNAIDESIAAKMYAERCGLEHTIVDVTWDDYLEYGDHLMKNKKAPLHAVEVGLYKSTLIAKKDGIKNLILGNGADSTFGGLDKLLSQDWTFDEFVNRYTFIDPNTTLNNPVSMLDIYEDYKIENGIDVIHFLKIVHGFGVIQAFENAIHCGGCEIMAPYECLLLNAPLDIPRIRKGESKYILRKIFKDMYNDLDIPDKIPFSRPMDQWLSDWDGPKRHEFIDNLDINKFTGDQKWLLYCLERFLDIHEL